MITGIVRIALGRATLATLGSMTPGASEFSVVRRLLARPEYGMRFTYQEVAGVVRQVMRAAAAAKSLMRRSVNALASNQIPNAPLSFSDSTTYTYRIVVEIQNPDTGQRFSTVVDVDSNELLRRDDAINIAQDRVQRRSIDSKYRTTLRAIGQDVVFIRSAIISISRN